MNIDTSCFSSQFDLTQVEEDDEVDLEKQEVEVGEHFTAVIGADHHCIQQLNCLTSKGRVMLSVKVV